MNLIDAFIAMSAFAYFWAVVLPIQFEKKTSIILQKLVYFLLSMVIMFSLVLDFWIAWWVLGAVYSFMAIYCYGGGQDWGSTGHNLLMTTWDLVLAVCFLMKVALP